MINSSRGSTGLTIETSFHTSRFHGFGFSCSYHVISYPAMSRNPAGNKLSTYVEFGFINSCTRHIQKLSSVSIYIRSSAAIAVPRMPGRRSVSRRRSMRHF
ncbi:hypothetical protein TNCV_1236971 [Trichonephila clavipes]|nr:hypothetical protein TNCV_1236971 [Trichonephila clavipes]